MAAARRPCGLPKRWEAGGTSAILIISCFFPPYNTIGAVRVGKTAKYLIQFGHDVRVIAARDLAFAKSLPLEIAPERVCYTSWLDVNRPVERMVGRPDRRPGQQVASDGSPQGLAQTLRLAYKTLLHFPDGHIGWAPFARKALHAATRDWKPDLIFASASPYTSLIVARQAARKLRVPWVAELRDLWTDNHYYVYPPWRRRLERRLEARTVRSAAGFVTVSEPLAEVLRRRFGKPTVVSLNGFDPADYPPLSAAPPTDGKLRIVYTGQIIAGKRNPAPLFQALALLGERKAQVRVDFYGTHLEPVPPLAQRHGVEDCVHLHAPVSFHESAQLQRQADALLLLLWDDPGERGVYTGKLFEYIGAQRQILAIGPKESVAAQLICERKVGTTLSRPEEIAAQLESWLDQKAALGALPGFDAEAARGLTREEQAQRIEEFLVSLAPRAAAVPSPQKAHRHA